MKRFPTSLLAVLLMLALGFSACGDPEPPSDMDGVTQATPPTAEHEHMDGHEAGEAATPRMEDGVQVAEIEAGRMGYAPGAVHLAAGVPARLVFTRTVDSACSSQIQIPAFDVPPTDLPMNEPVAISFTPSESGDFTFVCGMDMQRGSLLIKS